MKLKKKMGGFVQTAELVLISTVLVTGLTVGLVNVRDAVNTELEDVAESIGSLDQSYAFTGIVTSGAAENFVSGSTWLDTEDNQSTFASGDGDFISYIRDASDSETGS